MVWTSTGVVILIIIIVLVIAIVFYWVQDKIPKYNVTVNKGKFVFLNERQWSARPIIPTSKNTLVGIPTFEEDRYDETLSSE
jgi:hypothetical protein